MQARRLALAMATVLALAAGVGAYLWSSRPPELPAGLPFVAKSAPKPLPPLRFLDGAARARSLDEFRGKLVVLNVWATWCAPCREEMPALDRLQATLGGPGFEVVALSVDQQGVPLVRRFFDDLGIKSLQLYVDPSAQEGLRLAGAGLPTTLLVDRSGREIGRHLGPAKWDDSQIVEALRKMAEVPPR